MALQKFFETIRSYPFQIKHISVLFFIIIAFQIIVSVLHKAALEKFLFNTQTWYQQDSAERLANLTATSLELLLETRGYESITNERDATSLILGLNIILSQQVLNQNVKEVCILVHGRDGLHAIDEGHALFAHMVDRTTSPHYADEAHPDVISRYQVVDALMRQKEEIHTEVEGNHTFHVFVPFVIRGEFVGVMYMKNSPDFSFITHGVIASYDQTAITFSALILFGLLAMFYISSYTVRARNEAQHLLFEKEKERLTEHINHQKELMFTKRVYHTHHKAEKVIGFIKEDLRRISVENIDVVKDRVTKYSNFVARVIYDMKWYDPPTQTIRSPLFRTQLNDVLRFLVANVFNRVSSASGGSKFELCLDNQVPTIPFNEYVVWEAVEPIIQNSIEHAGVPDVVIAITTRFDVSLKKTFLCIADNGVGVKNELMERNEEGIRRIFLEHTTTKSLGNQNSGYGCYIAHEIATQRCGWELDVENLDSGGCRFVFAIPHHEA